MDKIPILQAYMDKDEIKNVSEAIRKKQLTNRGDFVKEFEGKFSKYIGTKHAVSTSSGTTALHLALLALDIQRGDEVIMPVFTYVATANAVSYNGAICRFVDVNGDYWCIDPEKIEEAITRYTKAIIIVHLYGHPCDMDKIMRIAKKHKLYVIEDCAEAIGTEYKGKKVGTFGIISCFSFFANKVITTCEGGMCLTNDKGLADRMRKLANQGVAMDAKDRYWHDEIGYNYRITNIQAAIGVAQMKKLKKFIQKRRLVAKLYDKYLNSESHYIRKPREASWAKSIFWAYPILVQDKRARDKLAKRLEEEGIETRKLFYPLNELPIYKSNNEFRRAEMISERGLSLPSSYSLTEKDIKRIAEAVKRILYEYDMQQM